MTPSGDRKAVLGRRKALIGDRLEDLPRQISALENAMSAFGDDFDLDRLKAAFETEADMDAYNQVQALERAVGRTQNYVAELSVNGVLLAGLDLPVDRDEGKAARAFEVLREQSVIDGSLCRLMKRAQRARSRLEHDYVSIPAGDLRTAAELVLDCAGKFRRSYTPWIAAFL